VNSLSMSLDAFEKIYLGDSYLIACVSRGS
jgi:hypothetical protein